MKIPEDRRIKALPRILFRLLAGVAAFLLLLFAALVLWLRYSALPHIDDYRADIASSLEKASGMAVAIDHIRGSWGGLRPQLTLQGLKISDKRGRTALAIDRADVTLTWWGLVFGRLRFHDLEFYRPLLALRRGTDGLIYLADKPLNERGPASDDRFTDWMLAQPRLLVHDAVLVWRDELGNAPEVQLTGVEIAVRRQRGRHHASVVAYPPRGLATRIEARTDLRLDHAQGHWKASGEIFAEALQADLGRLRAHLPVPESLRAGVGSVRVWSTLEETGVKDVVADLRMRDASVRLASDVLPLELATLAGRATYRAEPHGFTFGTRNLQFHRVNGEETRTGTFSLTYETPPNEPPHGAVRADGIDLKIAASLMDYFPVPRDVKGQVLRFAPRGRLVESSLTWTGESAAKARTYAIKGKFVDLAVNAVDAFPGVAGMSGSVEGTEKGGTLHLATQKATFDLERIFRAPIPIDQIDANVRWTHDAQGLEVVVDDAHFANADAEGKASGSYRTAPNSPGIVDVRAQLTRADVTKVGQYMPNRFAVTREWLDHAIQAGRSTRADFELKGDLANFPFADGKLGRFFVEGDFHGGKLKYHPEWPSVDDVEGTLRFEGRRMEIRGTSAKIFASRVTSALAVVNDLASHPALLVIDGDVDTSGGDSVRFLRESPLVNGPGAFTRAVAIEGPGQLKLHLEYPLMAHPVVKVKGDYQFAGATASVGRELAMRDVRGKLSFTETGVSAPEITGTIFGSPAVLRMATQPEGPTVTTIEGRLDAAATKPFLPAGLFARMSGAASWNARLVSSRDQNALSITSDLKGLGVALPDPLAKAADDARTLIVTFGNLGTDKETAIAQLAGGVNARFAKRGERWQVALKFREPLGNETLKDGLWLYGSLAALDVDAWLDVFREKPAVDAQAAPTNAVLELRGMHVQLGRVRYRARDFTQVSASLEKEGTEWSGKLDGPGVSGDVRWDPAGKGKVVARLARLGFSEPAKAADAPDTEPAEGDSDLPAIDVVAERFEFRGRWLGKLDIKADPAGDEWRIDHLNISNGHAQFVSGGGWRRTATGSITQLNVKLDSENLNALFAQFGFGDYMRRGTAHLEGTLVWPGLPHEFGLARMSGTFKVDARRGQFAKIEPGAGKLLGLLSLQSLPRRATFDFRDVFSEGFAFERITGDVKVARGILLTDNFEISGPSAFVTFAGEVSLPQETQSLTMHVVPEVSESIALAASLVGTPVLGLSTLLVSKLLKNPFGKAVAYEYQVTGSWDNPNVTRTSAAPPSTAASAPPK